MPLERPLGTNPGRVEVSVVTNSRLLHDGLLTLLARHLELHLVASYGGGCVPCTTPPNPRGHIVLLDGTLGHEAVTRWTRYWHGLTPPAYVLAIELLDDTDALLECIEAGVSGYTLQGASAADVAEAINGMRDGTAQCSPRVVANLFARVAALSSKGESGAPAEVVSLTRRELEILSCINRDCSNQEIAAMLVIEVRTVKHHVHNILQKLKLRHRWDAARLAVERGWLESSSSDAAGT